jgi:hypothetical protein
LQVLQHDPVELLGLHEWGEVPRVRHDHQLRPGISSAMRFVSSGLTNSSSAPSRMSTATLMLLSSSSVKSGATFDREAYREGNVVEQLINRLKQWRRIATHYEKRTANYRGMVTITAILLWLHVCALDEPGARYGVGVPAVGVAGGLTAVPAK